MTKIKNLGQVYTPIKVCKFLLSFLAINEERSKKIIDPFCGIGNFLSAYKEKTEFSELLFGVEKDGDNKYQLYELFGDRILIGDSFSSTILSEILNSFPFGLDIVATNPPYIRYQNSSEISYFNQAKMELMKFVNSSSWMTNEQKRKYLDTLKKVSGLSDLSVLGVILSMALVSKDGNLILILPESWLSREYSKEPLSLLISEFQIDYFIEDSNNFWFSDYQIKTFALICSRKTKRNKKMNHLTITGENENSFQFIENTIINAEDKFSFTDNMVPLTIRQIEEKLSLTRNKMLNLKQYGVIISQGLRTGANPFFYFDFISEEDGISVLKPSKVITDNNILIPNEYLLKVIRGQNDLAGNGITVKDSGARLLVISKDNNEVLPSSLREYLEIAEKIRYKDKQISEFSAIKPNIRYDKKNGVKISDWYNLPKLKSRHLPQLFVPRINDCNIKVFEIDNSYEPIVIDANFSTFVFENSEIEVSVVRNLLLSVWGQLFLETSATKMGAGGLKVEAKHLNNFLIPLLTKDEMKIIAKFNPVTDKEIMEEFIFYTIYGEVNKEKMDKLKLFFSNSLNKSRIERRG